MKDEEEFEEDDDDDVEIVGATSNVDPYAKYNVDKAKKEKICFGRKKCFHVSRTLDGDLFDALKASGHIVRDFDEFKTGDYGTVHIMAQSNKSVFCVSVTCICLTYVLHMFGICLAYIVDYLDHIFVVGDYNPNARGSAALNLSDIYLLLKHFKHSIDAFGWFMIQFEAEKHPTKFKHFVHSEYIREVLKVWVTKKTKSIYVRPNKSFDLMSAVSAKYDELMNVNSRWRECIYLILREVCLTYV